jgi:RimJ/RimL family protein N-acetyltransferase
VGSVNLTEKRYVGVYVGEAALWGNQIGRRAVVWICRQHRGEGPIFAEIDVENERSKRLFQACGFTEHDRDDDWVYYRLD